MKIIIDDPFVGKTVKDILISHLGLSRGQISFLKRSGGIRVNSQEVTVRYMLSLSDELELDLEDKAEDINPMIEPVFHELDILYEDTDIICINKPSGMATHPSHNHHGDTLANALVYYYKEKGKPFVFRAELRSAAADFPQVYIPFLQRRDPAPLPYPAVGVFRICFVLALQPGNWLADPGSGSGVCQCQ